VNRDDTGGRGSSYKKRRSESTAENRKPYRHPVHFRIALIHKKGEKNEIYHGRTHDLSIWGASILVDANIFVMTEVVMLLAIPPLHTGMKETIIEIQCRMSYTVLDSEQSRFRIGIRFQHFKGDGKHILTEVLSKRTIPKSDSTSYVVD
jgi:hypothetical protein